MQFNAHLPQSLLPAPSPAQGYTWCQGSAAEDDGLSLLVSIDLKTTNPEPYEIAIQRSSATKVGIFFYGYNTQMEFFFPEDNLTRAVPEETKISALSAQPYPDGYRVRVNIEVTPFQKRPYIEVLLNDSNGNEVASTSIVEPMSWKLEFTMHIRGELNNPYTLSARLYYPEGEGPSKEPIIYSFDVEPPPASPEADSA